MTYNTATITIDTDKCVLCGECIKDCPNSALEESDYGTILWFAEDCNSCGICSESCDFDALAIEY